jgi:hypothetical protein
MEDKIRAQIVLSEKAKALLDNEAYQKAWTAVMDGLQNQRAKLPITDKDGAQALLVCERMALKFRQALEGFVTTGKMLQEQLRIDNERQKWKDKLMPDWLRKVS